MKLTEKKTYMLPWAYIAEIISAEIEKILGIKLACTASCLDDSYWDVQFSHYHMPLSQVGSLLEETKAPKEAWEDALPDENEYFVTGLGQRLPTHMVQRYLALTWEHELITPEGFWLVGVNNKPEMPVENDDIVCLAKILLEAAMDTLTDLRKQEGKDGTI